MPLTFLRASVLVTFVASCGQAGSPQGSLPMTLVNRLSVVAAYVAFAFVAAIVLGVF